MTGVVTLVIIQPVWQGKRWTWPTALASLAIPAIGGMYMTFVSFVEDALPPSMVITLVGLPGYWGLLLLRSDRTRRGIDFVVFTLLGVGATLSFVIAFGAMRQLMARPSKPLFVDTKIVSLTIGGPVSGIGAGLIFAAIPLLAARKSAGWWLGVIGGTSIVVANLPTFVISQSLYYLMAAIAGLILTAALLMPAVKEYLIGSSARGG